MRALLGLMFVVLAACAGQATDPDQDTGAIIGEVGDPRNRAKLHTELASLYYSNGNLGVALEELRAATKADGNYAPAYGMYGLVYMQTRAEQQLRAWLLPEQGQNSGKG